jgi:GTPase SAR1 family protein
MNKQVLGLYGTANAGKSTTLRKLYELLTKAYPAAHIEIIHPVRVDFTVIIEIDGVLIGIESQGDPGSRLAESIELFKKRGCVIIVCTTRTRGSTVVIVEALQPEFTITWHHKIAGEDDSKMAQTIFKQIQDALGA